MDIQPLEPIEIINQRLIDHFGKFEDGRANWRLIWSSDEREYRLSEYSLEGLQLSRPEMLFLPKYSLQKDRYILEYLQGINNPELTTKTSYEPLWTFEDKDGNPLPPIWDAIYLLINQVQINMLAAGRNPIIKQPYGMGNTPDELKMRAESLQKELFGNENAITDALSLDSAVGYGTRKRNDWLQ